MVWPHRCLRTRFGFFCLSPSMRPPASEAWVKVVTELGFTVQSYHKNSKDALKVQENLWKCKIATFVSSPYCSVYLFLYEPHCIFSFVEHWSLSLLSLKVVISLVRCHAVSNRIFFGKTKFYLGGHHSLLRRLTREVLVMAEIVGTSLWNCCVFSHPVSAHVYLQ